MQSCTLRPPLAADIAGIAHRAPGLRPLQHSHGHHGPPSRRYSRTSLVSAKMSPALANSAPAVRTDLLDTARRLMDARHSVRVKAEEMRQQMALLQTRVQDTNLYKKSWHTMADRLGGWMTGGRWDELRRMKSMGQLSNEILDERERMVAAVRKLMDHIPCHTCVECTEGLRIGDRLSGERQSVDCLGDHRDSRNGHHLWRVATLEDVLGSDVLFMRDDFGEPTVWVPALVELALQAGADMPETTKPLSVGPHREV